MKSAVNKKSHKARVFSLTVARGSSKAVHAGASEVDRRVVDVIGTDPSIHARARSTVIRC